MSEVNWEVVVAFAAALAAIASAFAAFASCRVARRVLDFQKKSLLKRKVIELLSSAAGQMALSRVLVEQDSNNWSDDQFTSQMNSWPKETKSALNAAISALSPSTRTSCAAKIKIIQEFVKGLSSGSNDFLESLKLVSGHTDSVSRIDEVMAAIEDIYSTELKQ